jgi:hypothetical protein
MTYLQLALNYIPAVVTHGNTLTMQTYSKWYTPAFILGEWPKRIKMRREVDAVKELLKFGDGETEQDKPPKRETNNAVIKLPPQVEYAENENRQMMFA